MNDNYKLNKIDLDAILEWFAYAFSSGKFIVVQQMWKFISICLQDLRLVSSVTECSELYISGCEWEWNPRIQFADELTQMRACMFEWKLQKCGIHLRFTQIAALSNTFLRNARESIGRYTKRSVVHLVNKCCQDTAA